ncbi:DUF421 domain-containing protein [Alkalihalobacillus sp. CinArs1]|uniref:DUF421 domain-containing protein n=1 Tax=Alkalihalobacillus sp. CinArs1 TaxID=2995314 RepID=UPI0022DD6867|nr:DUF421 domain-containing protein [Alkalihalobacillus sp. CinArs1]
MDILMDSLKVIFRIATILPLMLAIGLYMGKRSIGELPVFDFLVVLVFGAVVGADIADPKIDHVHTVIAMIAIALLQKLIIKVKLKNPKLGKLFTFEPTVVMYQGTFLKKNMKRIQYSVDNILQMLREKDVFHTSDVELAIVEANGQLSVKLYPGKEGILREDMQIYKAGNDYEIPVILDGRVQRDLLERIGKTEQWLLNELHTTGKGDVSEIFYAGVTGQGELSVSKKDLQTNDAPPIEH